jgi:hypothetical protein
VTLDMPVKGDAAVVRLVEWHRLQPMVLNRLAPLVVEDVGVAGVGGASRRMNAAKFTVSEDISETVPMVVPKFGLLWLPLMILLESSGVALNTQPAVVLRSWKRVCIDRSRCV